MTDDIDYMHGVAQDAAAGRLQIVPVKQPASSPDLNVLDLGYFHSIQSLQQKKRTNNIEELVAAVTQSFHELHRRTLEKVFLSHQKVMEQVILHDGGNNYKLPHMKKDRLARQQGQLPDSIPVSEELRAKINAIQPGQAPVPGPVVGMESPPTPV